MSDEETRAFNKLAAHVYALDIFVVELCQQSSLTADDIDRLSGTLDPVTARENPDLAEALKSEINELRMKIMLPIMGQ